MSSGKQRMSFEQINSYFCSLLASEQMYNMLWYYFYVKHDTGKTSLQNSNGQDFLKRRRKNFLGIHMFFMCLLACVSSCKLLHRTCWMRNSQFFQRSPLSPEKKSITILSISFFGYFWQLHTAVNTFLHCFCNTGKFQFSSDHS